jgi:hypothetical protein
MDSRTEEILKAFPGLRYDGGFRITSPEDADYNCIAWAFGRKDRWLWPDEDVDGVEVWPQNSKGDVSIRTFIEAYKLQGYEVCDSDELETDMEKVALYAYPDTDECTHAARQLTDGMWTSKLGPSFDICHSSPYTIQGRLYGMVVCILRRVR